MSSLCGIEKAAILTSLLGEKIGIKLFSSLNSAQQKKLADAMRRLNSDKLPLSKKNRSRVLSEFQSMIAIPVKQKTDTHMSRNQLNTLKSQVRPQGNNRSTIDKLTTESVHFILNSMNKKEITAALYGMSMEWKERFLNALPGNVSQALLEETIVNAASYSVIEVTRASQLFFNILANFGKKENSNSPRQQFTSFNQPLTGARAGYSANYQSC